MYSSKDQTWKSIGRFYREASKPDRTELFQMPFHGEMHLERIIVGNMKIAAYQFAVSGCMNENFNRMKSAIIQAAEKDVKLLVFPECALTGYPPYDISKSSDIDFKMVSLYQEEFKCLSYKYNMYIVVGMITRQDMKIYNSAVIFSPEKENSVYHKRALWGWDRDNFCVGKEKGIFDILINRDGCYKS